MENTDQNDLLKGELRWWIDVWDAALRQGRFWNPDVPKLVGIHDAEDLSYKERRWMEAKAQGIRILREAQIENQDFFKGKIVMEIGPGPVGFLDGCNARLKIAVEPLANAFRRSQLLLPTNDVIYLTTGAEHIPLIDDFVDIVVSRNSLDHVKTPTDVIEEVWRILKPNGYFLVNVDIEHQTRPLEPHNFSIADLEQMLARFRVQWKMVYDESHGREGRMFVARCVKSI